MKSWRRRRVRVRVRACERETKTTEARLTAKPPNRPAQDFNLLDGNRDLEARKTERKREKEHAKMTGNGASPAMNGERHKRAKEIATEVRLKADNE